MVLSVLVGIQQKNIVFAYITEYPGKCWHSGTKKAYDIGTHHPNDTCVEIYCSNSYSLNFYR